MTGHVPEFGGHDAETVGHDGPKYAIHLAAQASVASSFSDPVATFEVNALGTIRLLEALKSRLAGSEVAFSSSAPVRSMASSGK
ncbi:GDP-mannose 4,6-dehydratase, partial [Piscinibacter sp.]|uniref:GDP-mannose 4,6-dehydratase n=1 Tax=Piscinibacter sp. TaxID=1903157 RepID=UPI00355A60EB